MRTKFGLLFVFLALVSPAQALEAGSPPVLAPMEEQAKAAHLSAQLLTHYHYKKVPLDDALSAKIIDRYIEALDSERFFFLQSDIDQFTASKDKIDDAIYSEDLSIPFAIFNVYEQRVVERLSYARELLKNGFDFSQNEEYVVMRDKEPWPKSEAESRELWRKRVKNDWLRLKLAGTADATIRETLGKRYANSQERAYKYKSNDVFQIFMNAYTTSIEPHTDYFGVAAASDFDISMKLSLVGIGAVLQERDEYTTIRELVPGGPAQLSGQLAVGDRIVGVAQGKDGAFVDVVGTRVNEVVKLIRGEKDTVVRLDVLPTDAGLDGKHRAVTLVRDKINLEKQAARKSVQIVTDGDSSRKIGVISLPTFYEDFEARRRGDKNYRSASRDVAKLLDELEKDKVDGVVIDLRNNGGGSLPQAIELTGLFVGKGPVLQQRNGDGEIKVNGNTRATARWTGPLAVLINRGSASASEIFAAAIQDYGRGVIVGEPSFGKGTVQTVVDLDEEARNAKPEFGELKMTVAQFFRINGGTTQLRGVTPDISLPGFADDEKLGESSYDNALPWLQVKPADYSPLGDIKQLVPELQSRHQARVDKDKDFSGLVEDVNELNDLRKKRVISLNETERRTERDRQVKRLKAREAAEGKGSVSPADLVFQEDGLQANERSLSADIASEKAQKDAKDVLLEETMHILNDESDLLKVQSAKNN
ncbi:carboxy terminal-processing peptidase [Phyllobacterium zundukense]|uniref:Tail-specific protease n=1 Tax=Phyllobacterium zundukense TaxID=1867719 RepID=A0A2N9VZN6_9HYPH|nr:carboxy terminal-processing peptidase [Phyllobacterium zundukense]ATU93636.1 tail-specific protease [Phyllobacterium zundukense]PIO44954.1 tail-specific protease [Phyllobacterium zundukense]